MSRNIKKFTSPFFTRSSIFDAYLNSIRIDFWEFEYQFDKQNFISFITKVFFSLHGLKFSWYLTHIKGWCRKILPPWYRLIYIAHISKSKKLYISGIANWSFRVLMNRGCPLNNYSHVTFIPNPSPSFASLSQCFMRSYSHFQAFSDVLWR